MRSRYGCLTWLRIATVDSSDAVMIAVRLWDNPKFRPAVLGLGDVAVAGPGFLRWRLSRGGADCSYDSGLNRSAASRCAGSTPASWIRELMPSFTKTFRRWYATVAGLMNSWAAISEFDAPPLARRATSPS